MSRQLFLAMKLIAFLYILNSKCTGAQLWNSQTGFKLKKKHCTRGQEFEVAPEESQNALSEETRDQIIT